MYAKHGRKQSIRKNSRNGKDSKNPRDCQRAKNARITRVTSKNKCAFFADCPRYPCENNELGKWIKSLKGDIIWTCIDCELIHERKVARYLKKHPNASVEELQKVAAGM